MFRKKTVRKITFFFFTGIVIIPIRRIVLLSILLHGGSICPECSSSRHLFFNLTVKKSLCLQASALVTIQPLSDPHLHHLQATHACSQVAQQAKLAVQAGNRVHCLKIARPSGGLLHQKTTDCFKNELQNSHNLAGGLDWQLSPPSHLRGGMKCKTKDMLHISNTENVESEIACHY